MVEEDKSSTKSTPLENLGSIDSTETETKEQNDSLEPTLDEKIEQALKDRDQFLILAQRAQADLENYKKRASQEKEEIRHAANSRLILKMLSVVDDLQRAMSTIPIDPSISGWAEGLQLVLRNINNIIHSEGVTKIEAEGRPFDPQELEAIQFQETSDVEEGTVIKVLQDGYKDHDKVLRAAQVIVAKRPAAYDQENPTEEYIQ